MSSEHDAARHELLWPWLAVAALALGGAVAVGSVVWRGNGYRTVIHAAAPTAAAGASAPHGLGDAPLSALTGKLQQRLRANPGDADGWAMLARTHAVSGNYARAVPAFRQAVALRPDDAVLLADFADALAMTQDRRIADEAATLVRRALALAPDHPKVLSLAGSEAYARGDWPAALRHWDHLVAAAGERSVFARQVRHRHEEARRRAGASPH